jgi:hypothetical protein
MLVTNNLHSNNKNISVNKGDLDDICGFSIKVFLYMPIITLYGKRLNPIQSYYKYFKQIDYVF